MAWMRQELRAFGAATAFLTRVPLPLVADEADMRRAGPYFPLVGAALGGVAGMIADRSGAELGLIGTTLLTGALHLDALADVADATGAPTRARALEIMRDPRIGAFGASALMLDLMLKRAALARCAPRHVVAVGALSRAVPVVLAAALPYARPNGAGAALARGGGQRAASATAIALGCSLAAARRDGARLAGAAALLTLAWGLLTRQLIGATTGDVLGASVELTETILLHISAQR